MNNIFNNLKNYIKDEEYLISFSSFGIHLYNYKCIGLLKNNEIEILFNNLTIILFGNNFVVKELDKKEVYITGEVNNVKFRRK